MTDPRILNLLFALITGRVWETDGGFPRKLDIWEFRPGVDFFVSHFIKVEEDPWSKSYLK